MSDSDASSDDLEAIIASGTDDDLDDIFSKPVNDGQLQDGSSSEEEDLDAILAMAHSSSDDEPPRFAIFGILENLEIFWYFLDILAN